ncbi:MAG: DUF1573 domain-containing protein [Candidatus Amesbacteria bacterium]|nr:DUF1573 domain-containing protein [Candidatus Amesbacteria bacterium]
MTPKTIAIFVVGLAAFMGVAIWILTKNQDSTVIPKTNVFSKVEALETVADLGEMKVADVKSRDFTIKNVGSNPLQITSISSSCNCVSGQIVYKGQTSKEYGMHAPGGFVNQIAVGDTAVVRVIYKPYIMPVYGPVTRDVYVGTNDPDNPKLTFTVKTVVK